MSHAGRQYYIIDTEKPIKTMPWSKDCEPFVTGLQMRQPATIAKTVADTSKNGAMGGAIKSHQTQKAVANLRRFVSYGHIWIGCGAGFTQSLM